MANLGVDHARRSCNLQRCEADHDAHANSFGEVGRVLC